jgi:hypothetical protein
LLLLAKDDEDPPCGGFRSGVTTILYEKYFIISSTSAATKKALTNCMKMKTPGWFTERSFIPFFGSDESSLASPLSDAITNAKTTKKTNPATMDTMLSNMTAIGVARKKPDATSDTTWPRDEIYFYDSHGNQDWTTLTEVFDHWIETEIEEVIPPMNKILNEEGLTESQEEHDEIFPSKSWIGVWQGHYEQDNQRSSGIFEEFPGQLRCSLKVFPRAFDLVVPQILDGRIVLRIRLEGDVVKFLFIILRQSIDLALLLGQRAHAKTLTPASATPEDRWQEAPKPCAKILLRHVVIVDFARLIDEVVIVRIAEAPATVRPNRVQIMTLHERLKLSSIDLLPPFSRPFFVQLCHDFITSALVFLRKRK